jgi:hypothetical protein
MGVEAWCCPSKSAAHCCHMKRQPFLCNGCPCHGRCNCHCRRHLRRHFRLRYRRNCHRRHNCPSPSPLPSAIAIGVAINHCCRHLCCVAISHCCCLHPCQSHCYLRHRWPSQLPSPSAITVAMPLAISENCFLGMARILFDQLKQRMLNLFYFVWTVGGALIEAG